MIGSKALLQKLTTHYSWWVLLLTLIATIVTAVGMKNLYFRGDYKIYFEKGYQPLIEFEEMQSIFNKSDNVAVLIVPENGSVKDERIIQLVADYTEAAWQTPFSSRVDSLANYQHTWSEEDDMIVEDLVNPNNLSQDELERIISTALEEPLLNGRMISESAAVSLINITVQIPDSQNNTPDVSQVVGFVENMSQEFAEKYPDVNFYHTGVLPMNNGFATEGRKDMSTLVPAMLLLIVVLLAILLRSVFAMLATVVVLILAVAGTMGLGGWLGYFLSTGSINVPIVILTIAVADCVHIAASTQFAMGRGKEKAEAIRHSLDLNLMPVLITSVTTAIGFLTLTLSESPVFADFGVLSAMGVMFACVLSLTVFPALLNLLPIRATTEGQGDLGMAKLAEFVVNNQKALLIGGAISILGISSLATRNSINDVATEYFSPATEFRQSTLAQEKTLSGSMSIDWAFYTDEAGGISEPEFISVLEGFSEWLRVQPEVDHVSTLSDTFKRLNKNMHGDDTDWYRVPDDRELAAQYLLLYEMSLPYGLDLNNQIDIDKSAVRITSILKNLGSKELVDLESRAREWVATNAGQYRMTAASPGLMFSHIGERNMDSMLLSMFFAVLIISAIMIFALRSVRLGAISLLPNLTPAVVGFGFWSIISGEINLGLSIVSSMTLGIIVDDSVHFLSKYKRARTDGLDTEAAVRYAFSSVGRALVITTVVLVLGFSMLGFSAFRLNSDMGIATALIIFIALVIDFLFLPPLLLWLDKDDSVTDEEGDMSEAAEYERMSQ